MQKIYYKVQGTNDVKPNVGEIDAKDADVAMDKLKGIYGDSELVEITIIKHAEFERLQQKNGHDSTHRPE